jgi:hypothetical protein
MIPTLVGVGVSGLLGALGWLLRGSLNGLRADVAEVKSDVGDVADNVTELKVSVAEVRGKIGLPVDTWRR